MKLYFALAFISFTTTLFSQSKMNGKVLDDGGLLPDVEVINSTKAIVIKTNDNGNFQILADVNDEIIFYSKNHIQINLKVKNKDLTVENEIILQRKQIELEELKIDKSPSIKIDMSYESLKMTQISKEQARPKAQIYMGEIQNGTDFVAIGAKLANLISKLFVKKGGKKEFKSTESFSKIVKNKFTDDFFIGKLNLNESEVDLFLTFCEMDESSKIFHEQTGVLELIDFLIKKRKEFK